MKHTVKISTPWEAKCIGGQDVLRVRCDLPEARSLVLALCLLREELVCSFVIPGHKGQKLELVLDRERRIRPMLKWSGDGVEIGLSTVTVDMLINFYLIYHRDGLADVNHVDIETTTDGYLTFFAAETKPPRSRADFERLLLGQ